MDIKHTNQAQQSGFTQWIQRIFSGSNTSNPIAALPKATAPTAQEYPTTSTSVTARATTTPSVSKLVGLIDTFQSIITVAKTPNFVELHPSELEYLEDMIKTCNASPKFDKLTESIKTDKFLQSILQKLLFACVRCEELNQRSAFLKHKQLAETNPALAESENYTQELSKFFHIQHNIDSAAFITNLKTLGCDIYQKNTNNRNIIQLLLIQQNSLINNSLPLDPKATEIFTAVINSRLEELNSNEITDALTYAININDRNIIELLLNHKACTNDVLSKILNGCVNIIKIYASTLPHDTERKKTIISSLQIILSHITKNNDEKYLLDKNSFNEIHTATIHMTIKEMSPLSEELCDLVKKDIIPLLNKVKVRNQ